MGIAIFLIISFMIGYPIVRIYQRIFKKKKKPPLENPYIEEHKMRMFNDMMYEDYIKWMDKNGHGLPVDKIKTPEEIRFEQEMKDTHKTKR